MFEKLLLFTKTNISLKTSCLLESLIQAQKLTILARYANCINSFYVF